MTMRKDIEFGRGMAVPAAKKLDREGNEMNDATKRAEVEVDLATDTFRQIITERGISLEHPLFPVIEGWWVRGYQEGYKRGITRGVNDTQRVALEALESMKGVDDEETNNR